MTASRDAILKRVNDALAPLKERAPYPEFDDDVAVMPALDRNGDLWTAFCERAKLVHGTPLSGKPAVLADWLHGQNLHHGYCDPELLPLFGEALAAAGCAVETIFDRARVDEYQFGITRAEAAIAETGSLVLTDATTSSRLAALAPWTHVAVLKRGQIFADVADALKKMPVDPNVIWCTGPSRTADVEGILIEGVHGPGVQVAFLLE
ncbi:L-lactate dehydrogenase complex protein LldG [Ereboglobus sp. PH5-10]|uniref:LutC/YkgG family protein n=1 Tax=Ereboglobus sp. PH5-10 TaxID=2940629 RepID=UPI00240760D6|nr:LUD domain-containing protein [Ereboglobus sp. PH5-10]MDF9826934.1 L-lactate dehydrogenase complex protein LldG [Ereboglobus sp. PH5-10]